jgi:cobalt-zinc-cadmium efflux system outer membrane protein
MSSNPLVVAARSAVLVLVLPAAAAAQSLAPLPEQLFDPPVYPRAARSAGQTIAQAPNAAGILTLTNALRRALAANPRLTAAERDIGIAAGKRLQAAAVPNPELSFELDNAHGSGDYREFRSAETTLQLSQLVELGGKREARIAAGSADVENARWQRAALRLEIVSDTAVAFFNVLSGQRKVQIYDVQIASLERLTPLLQRRAEAGASSLAETSRSQLAADLVRAERERARTALAVARRELAAVMGANAPDYTQVAGELNRVGKPPSLPAILRGLDSNPQIVRWTAVRAQRDAELMSARLKSVPDVRVGVGWRHFRDSNDNAVRLNASIAIPVWDQNLGGILEAGESRAKVEAERGASRNALILTLGKAYETLIGALREIEILRSSALPNARRATEAIEGGYAQGRFTLLDVLDVQGAATQAALREQEALVSFHTSVATLEGLTGMPLGLSREASR